MKIIAPDAFVARPWKNGKGQTLELAINEGGSVESFDWRVSIAQIVEDGLFSDFSGYDRWLFLIAGNGVELVHDDVTTHALKKSLDVAQFDGGSKTMATLVQGPITDFNLMTRRGLYRVRAETCREAGRVTLDDAALWLAFSPRQPLQLRDERQRVRVTLPPGHLLVSEDKACVGCSLEGEEMIVVGLWQAGRALLRGQTG